MGKRSAFPRRARDAYDTPLEAVRPLVGHLPKHGTYAEPCAGACALMRHLSKLRPSLRCTSYSDIEPREFGVSRRDALADKPTTDLIITNPPWPARGGEPTIGLIQHWIECAPTWVLLNADVIHNRYFAKVSPYCAKIVSVGRVSWMENGTAGKENAAWLLFDRDHIGATRFFARPAVSGGG